MPALRDNEPLKVLADKSVFITRYADASAVYNNAKVFASGKKIEFMPKFGADTPLYEHHTTSLVFNDPPLHTRVRRILLGALTTKNFERMEPNIQRLVNELLDKADKKGRIDLVEDFATIVPIEVIGNLLDVPHEERGPLRAWSLVILGALEPVLTPEQMKKGNDAVTEFTTYLKDLVRRRKEKPGDPETDLLTRLLQGEPGTGEMLTESELLQNCVFLLNAGHETTTNLIANGLVSLYQHPDQLALLQSDPEKYMASAIDELLRFQSPNQLGNRRTTQAAKLGGMELEPGTRIHIGIGAANRDPEQFPNPDRLDITRSPNPHFAFASGVHRCLGEKLAKIEARIAIGGFIKRFPHYRVHEDKAVRSQRARFRGYTEIPVDVHG
ncbi:cytochrome P450 [Hyaloraphidium curvatum]|nr:cytochrome P450 [Hyaloraphidium curvatum]